MTKKPKKLNQYTARCEVCGCTWNRACNPPCSWDQDFWADGRAVCTSPSCLTAAAPLDE